MNNFIKSLKYLLEGKISEEQFRDLYSFNNSENVICDLMISLEHYLSDLDVRIKNKEYKKMQDNELKKLIYCLKNDKINEALKKINFLSESNINII